MARYISNKIANKQPAISGDDKGTTIFEKTTVAVDNALAANDLILFSKLPNGHFPVDGNIVSDQLDSNGSPTLVMTVGILNDAGTDLIAGTEFLKLNATIGRTAGGSITRFDQPAGLSLSALNAVDTASDKGTKETPGTATSLLGRKSGDRIIAAKVTTVAATKVAGNITLNFEFTPA